MWLGILQWQGWSSGAPHTTCLRLTGQPALSWGRWPRHWRPDQGPVLCRGWQPGQAQHMRTCIIYASMEACKAARSVVTGEKKTRFPSSPTIIRCRVSTERHMVKMVGGSAFDGESVRGAAPLILGHASAPAPKPERQRGGWRMLAGKPGREVRLAAMIGSLDGRGWAFAFGRRPVATLGVHCLWATYEYH